jgi:ABC-2 type transport system ATP-binding protein
MIELERVLHKYPKNETLVLDNVSFEIGHGQIFTLLGQNGAGKTTLVRILATLVLPTGGQIRVCGYDVVSEAEKVRRCIGMCSDSHRSFYYRLTGYQNLEFFGGLTGCHPGELKRQIAHTLELVGLSEARDKLFMHYSQGMRKRLSLARCLLGHGPVYLMDEPTSGVDPLGAATIRQILDDLRSRGKTILVTTHNIEEASRISDSVGILKDGKLAALDSPENLKQIVSKRRLIIVLQEPQHALEIAERIKRLLMLPDVKWNECQVEIVLDQACPVTPILKLISSDGIVVESVYEQQATLEDLYIQITGASNVT